MIIMIFIVMMVMVMMMAFLFLLCENFLEHLFLQVIVSFDCIKDNFPIQLGKGCCDDGCLAVVLAEQLHGLVDLLFAGFIRSCEKDGARVLNLIEEKLTEIADIHLRLGGIDNRNRAVHLHVSSDRRIVYRATDIGKLADSGGLDQDAVRMILLHDLLQRFSEIADQ